MNKPESLKGKILLLLIMLFLIKLGDHCIEVIFSKMQRFSTVEGPLFWGFEQKLHGVSLSRKGTGTAVKRLYREMFSTLCQGRFSATNIPLRPVPILVTLHNKLSKGPCGRISSSAKAYLRDGIFH